MGGVVKSIGHGISHVFKQVTHGVEHLFGEAGKVWSKITPWDDDTGLGKILNVASLAAIGYFGGSALDLWGGQEAAGTTTAGALAESGGSGSLFSAAGVPTTATGAVDFGASLGATGAATATEAGATGVGSSLSLMPAATGSAISATPATTATIASSTNLLAPAEQATSQGSLFTSALNFAKAHPLATGMIASGALQGVGSYLQGQAMQEMKEKEIEEQKREFNLLHNMGLDTSAPKVLSPVERLRLQQAQQQVTTPQELELLLRNYPSQSIETRAGRFRSDTNELVPLLQSYYNRGNIGLFTIPY